MKKFIKIYSVIILCFTALSVIAALIDFVIKAVREATESKVVVSTIPVTGSDIETASHWLSNLWLTPVGIFLALSLLLSLIWLYKNIKDVKKNMQKLASDFLGYE
ncbi:MAG: hypothetical protein WC467_03475 [Patescibacteria group bacterium]